jgi:hypothetical protein
MNQPILAALLAGGTLLAALASASPAGAGPVVCSTSIEAPLASAAPVEITRCGAAQTIPELISRRFYSYTAPFERGVDLTHQVTDLLGIAMGGGDGSRMVGFGFPDQTIVFDGMAVQNTAAALLEAQHNPMPLRTADLHPCLNASLAAARCDGSRLMPKPNVYGSSHGYGDSANGYLRSANRAGFPSEREQVRGLW